MNNQSSISTSNTAPARLSPLSSLASSFARNARIPTPRTPAPRPPARDNSPPSSNLASLEPVRLNRLNLQTPRYTHPIRATRAGRATNPRRVDDNNPPESLSPSSTFDFPTDSSIAPSASLDWRTTITTLLDLTRSPFETRARPK